MGDEQQTEQIDQKDYGYPGPMIQAFGGATTFRDALRFREAANEAYAYSMLTSDFSTLTNNILTDSEMTASQKATAMASLSNEFQNLIQSPPDAYKSFVEGDSDGPPTPVRPRPPSIVDKGWNPDWLANYEEKAGRRLNRRQQGMFKGALDTLRKLFSWTNYDPEDEDEEDDMDDEKATWSTAFINDLPDSSFLYVEPGGDKDPDGKTTPRSLRHFPYRDSSGSVDLPHLRNAIARAPQSNLGEGIISRVQSRARRILENATKEYDDEITDFITKDEPSGFKVFETKDGPRWLAFSSNAFQDRDKEIFTTKALEDAVKAVDDGDAEAGPLRIYHIPGADVGTTDYQAVIGRFLMESGTFDDTTLGQKAVEYFTDHPDENFQVSIGFQFKQGDEKDGVFDWVRIRERSVLPKGKAANPYTGFALGELGVEEMDEAKKQFLSNIVGADMADQIIQKAESDTKELEQSVAYKEASEGEKGVLDDVMATLKGMANDKDMPDSLKKKMQGLIDKHAPKEKAEDKKDDEPQSDTSQSDNSEVLTAIGKLGEAVADLKPLQESVTGLTSRLDELANEVKEIKSGRENEPRAAGYYRASAAESNLLDENKTKEALGENDQPNNPARKIVEELIGSLNNGAVGQ